MTTCKHVKRELGVALQHHFTNGRTCDSRYHKRGDGLYTCREHQPVMIEVSKCVECGHSVPNQ